MPPIGPTQRRSEKYNPADHQKQQDSVGVCVPEAASEQLVHKIRQRDEMYQDGKVPLGSIAQGESFQALQRFNFGQLRKQRWEPQAPYRDLVATLNERISEEIVDRPMN